MGRSLHNKIRLKSRMPLLGAGVLRCAALKAAASIGQIIVAIRSFK